MTSDHPYQVLDPLSDDEYQALRADIETNGIQVPIVTDEDGRILDGHNRKAIATELGIECPTKVLTDLTHEEKTDRAFTLNLARRQLNRDQKRQIICRSIQLNPELSDRAHAKRCSASPSTVAAVRREMEESGMVSKLDTRIGQDGIPQRAPGEPIDPHTFFGSEEKYRHAMRYAACTEGQFKQGLALAQAEDDLHENNVWGKVASICELAESDPEVRAEISMQLQLTKILLWNYDHMQELEKSDKWADYGTFDEFCRARLGASHYEKTVPRSVEDLIVDRTLVEHFGGPETYAETFPGRHQEKSHAAAFRYISEAFRDSSRSWGLDDESMEMMMKTGELAESGMLQVGGIKAKFIEEEANNTHVNMLIRPGRIPQQYAILRALVTDYASSLNSW